MGGYFARKEKYNFKESKEDLIGSGTYFNVYKNVSPSDNSEYAIKVLKPEFTKKSQQIYKDY